MKATEQYFHVVLFIMLYKLVLTFKSSDDTLMCDHSIESYWAVLSCGSVYYTLQGGSITFRSADENQVCNHSSESHWEVLSRGNVFIMVYKVVLTFKCAWNPGVWPFNVKVLSSTFMWCCFLHNMRLVHCTRGCIDQVSWDETFLEV